MHLLVVCSISNEINALCVWVQGGVECVCVCPGWVQGGSRVGLSERVFLGPGLCRCVKGGVE